MGFLLAIPGKSPSPYTSVHTTMITNFHYPPTFLQNDFLATLLIKDRFQSLFMQMACWMIVIMPTTSDVFHEQVISDIGTKLVLMLKVKAVRSPGTSYELFEKTRGPEAYDVHVFVNQSSP
jgi:hypothetical protein